MITACNIRSLLLVRVKPFSILSLYVLTNTSYNLSKVFNISAFLMDWNAEIRFKQGICVMVPNLFIGHVETAA